MGFEMSFVSIIWDLDEDFGGNVQHCAAHNVSKEEVEEVLKNPYSQSTSSSSGDPIAFGFTSAGRFLLVVYDQIDEDTIRPITAYDAPLGGIP
jgi:uncharacterized DUF497 family protein